TGLWRHGMQGPVDQSRCGKRGATMCKATRSTRAIFFRKRLPNTRPKLWTASSPLTRAGGGNLPKAWSRSPPAYARASIRYLVSENRDFLQELPALPLTVLSGEEAVRLLEESGS